MSKSYDVTGEIYKVDETKEYGANGFKKREFIIKLTGADENEQYPNYLKMELVKDKCALIDGFEMGQEIKACFNLGGRLWQGNGKPETCFVSLQAWRIEAIGNAPAQTAQATEFDEGKYLPEFDESGDLDSVPF